MKEKDKAVQERKGREKRREKEMTGNGSKGKREGLDGAGKERKGKVTVEKERRGKERKMEKMKG